MVSLTKSTVSIVIPSFNRSALLRETLDSVLAQTYSKWECLVVDDGSNDDTLQVVRDYSKVDERIKLFQRPNDRLKGPSSCRNIGLKLARGEFLVFLDSDDLLAPNCLENRLKFTSEYPEFDLWIFKTKNFLHEIHDDNRVFNTLLSEYSDKIYLKLFNEGYYPFCITGPLWRTEGLRKINGFDEKLNVFEDPDLHIRAFQFPLKSKTDITSLADSYYRIDPNKRSNTRTRTGTAKLDKGAYYFVRKHLKKNKQGLKRFCHNYFQKQVLDYSSFRSKLKFYWLFTTKGIFSFKEVLLLPVMMIYKRLRIDTVSGLGYYRLNKFVYPTNKD